MTYSPNAYEARAQGTRRLSALTAGIAAASVVGVGAVAAYDAHLLPSGTGSSTTPRVSTSSQTDDDGATGTLQSAPTAPTVTPQLPAATSGGS